MKKKLLLEISVECVEAAVAAERAGADRVELCADLGVGGITPAAETMRRARALLRIPILAMIRSRGGDFVYTREEFAQMMGDAELAKACGMDGLVFGALRPDATVDVERTREFVAKAFPLPVTFHRAFDEAPDPRGALEDVVAIGATRILTSGGMRSAPEGAAMLGELVRAAHGRIGILPGGGINPANLRDMVCRTGAKEFHSGLGSSLPYGRANQEEFEREVGRLAEILRELESSSGTNETKDE
jgi:copper homeostasis protein